MTNDKNIAVVAIARDEKPFMDEWLLYHRLIGVNHFFVYDDDPTPCLQEFLQPHTEYTTTIRWYNRRSQGNQQIKAYQNALHHHLADYQWVAFIDIDEFIVLEKNENLGAFLVSYENTSAVSLHWRRFGHNGHYEDPKGLITSELTRRKLSPCTNRSKCITKCNAIDNIKSVHHCELKPGCSSATANTAHINHYMCRSFVRWMNRPSRGDACDPRLKPDNTWKYTKEGCLQKFVTNVTLDWNEHVDKEMLKYKPQLEEAIRKIR